MTDSKINYDGLGYQRRRITDIGKTKKNFFLSFMKWEVGDKEVRFDVDKIFLSSALPSHGLEL